MKPTDPGYDTLEYWGNELQYAVVTGGSDYVVDVLRDYDPSKRDDVKALAENAIMRLTNNLVSTVSDAADLWQMSQCLKKFRYGPAISPEEMMAGWVERNKEAATELPPSTGWIFDEMRKLLAPLGPAYAALDLTGRFGNGAVFEKVTTLARWNLGRTFSYYLRDPDCVSDMRDSPSLVCRCSCVPKDMFKLRSITVEPAEATFLQQLHRNRLLVAVNAVMPFSTAIPQQLYGGGPEVQRKRCLEGSRTGHLATIDLSDASDCVRWDVVVRVFPACIVADLDRSRSPYCDVGGTCHRINMYAGMGNATTFIVETLYFWALCTALSHWLRDFTPVSVFGDDIVLSTKVACHPLFQQYLASCGVKLNMAKSGLSNGPGFREACGLAAYYGAELPLLRIKGYNIGNPEELCSLCGLVNTALDIDSRYTPFVRALGLHVGMSLRSVTRCPVLPEAPRRGGVYIVDSSETIGEWNYRSRWDPNYQEVDVKFRALSPTYKRVSVRHLTDFEALGILNGQLRTEFADAQLGYSSAKSVFKLPYGKMKLESIWSPFVSSDPSLLAFGGDQARIARVADTHQTA